MAFRKKVDFLQLERDELPHLRPVVIYITAPVHSKDFSMHSSQYKHFKAESGLPEGVLKRDANPFNLCLIEANQKLDKLNEQLVAALKTYKDSAHKVVVINAHATSKGVLLKEEGEEKVLLTGRQLAEVVSTHTHKHHLHVFAITSYGHKFADEFYSYIQHNTQPEVNTLIAVTYFTTETSPTAWDKIATSGNGHVEVTREIGDFIKSTIEPNSPYKMLDTQVAKSQCVIL